MLGPGCWYSSCTTAAVVRTRCQVDCSMVKLYPLYYSVQVTLACWNGGLAKLQSPVVRPNDSLKSSLNTRQEGYLYPTVYAHANHLYFAPQGMPHQPLCKKHGWESVEDGQVARRRTVCWTTLWKDKKTQSKV